MKNKLSLALFPLFLAHLYAEDIFNESKVQIQNTQRKDFNHLFDTKFPVNDYIYEAGQKKPDEAEALNNLTQMFENLKENNISLPINEEKNITKEQNNIQSKIDELKQKDKTLQKEVKKEQATQQATSQSRLHSLIRNNILGNRNHEIKDFSNSSRYGADSFSNQKSIDIGTNEHRLYRTIRAGRLIPALLMTAISSDLSGFVTAQIEQDIYASMGEAVLIPRGSKVLGNYTNQNAENGVTNRLQITWREIITPQGINILLTGANTSDNMGMSGAVGALNNKYLERYGIPYGLSTLSNALLLAISSKVDSGGNVYSQELYSSSRSDVESIVDEILQAQRNIKPTIEIKSGSRIFIVPSNHMWFSKPKNNEVLMQYFNE